MAVKVQLGMKFKIGNIYHITFKDHCMDTDQDEPMLCEAWGKCLIDNDEFIVICSWDLINAKESTRRDNQTRYVILKSTITKKKLIG